MRQDASFRYNMRRQDSRERGVPTVHLCHNGKTIVTPPVPDYRNTYANHYHHVMREDFRINRNNYLDTSICVARDRRSPCSPGCGTYASSPTETIAITPDALCSDEKREYISDEPEKYLKEIKLRIIQREKEYG